MPEESPMTSSPRSQGRRRASLARRPFLRLVVHFLNRLLRGDRDADSEFELGIGPLLGLLGAPGAFCSLLLFQKYSSLRDWIVGHPPRNIYTYSVADKYFFICLAMAIAGVVTALKWDKILPDSQDYLNLSPLPLRARTILLANATAIAAAITVFALDVNGTSAVLFPAVVSSYSHLGVGGLFSFMLVHGVVLILASLFTIFSIFAVLGALAAILPDHAFRAISAWVRGLVLVGAVGLLITVGAGPGWLRAVQQHPSSFARFFPSLWFLGLYQNLQHVKGRGIEPLAGTALTACAIAFALMVISYAFSYRRRFAAVLEGARPPARQWLLAATLRFLDFFSAGALPFERACHRFVIRAMLRDETHRLAIAVSIGLGWLLALQAISSDSEVTRLAGPLAAAYPLILGLRIAFEIPAGVPSNWVFRVILDPRAHETYRLTRRILLAFLVPTVVVPAFLIGLWQLGPLDAVLHALYVLALTLVLGEALLSGYRKIPLTSPLPALQANLPVLVVINATAFALFTQLGARFEKTLLEIPWLFPIVPGALGIAWFWNRRRIAEARVNGEWEEGFTFDSAPPPTVNRLDLFDASYTSAAIRREAPPSGQPL